MASPFVALLDANVLYPAPLRDFLLRLADDQFFAPKWSSEIHDEWTRNLLENRPDLTLAQIARTRARMDAAFSDALVAGYESRIPALANHPKDRHVLAAAIQGDARWIVTFNLKDFPDDVLFPHRIEAIHPDRFVLKLCESGPEEVVQMIRQHRAQLTRPPKTAREYLDSLETCGLVRTAQRLREFEGQL